MQTSIHDQRLIAQDALGDDQRTGLESLRHGCDPVVLLETIRRTLFAEHQGQIEQWWESVDSLSAAEGLKGLMALAPGHYHEGQARSMERRVREWRAARSERLLGTMRSTEMVDATEETAHGVATPIGGNI
jgi:hypothetical protein